MIIGKIICGVALMMMLMGCSSLAFWRADDEPEIVSSKTEDRSAASDAKADEGFFSGLFGAASEEAPTKSPLIEEQELKLAKLWARVDELEEEQLRQKERLRLLEKGLTLGLTPEEMKPAEAAPPAEVPSKPALNHATPSAPIKKEPPAPSLSKEEAEHYQAALASAHDHFRAGRYGRAIVEYSEIGKAFGDKVDGGMHKYWIARSWMNLKEFNAARQHLEEFLKEYPTSPWAARGKLELARVEWKLGLSETALQRFRQIIEQYPYEDAAEMARMEIRNLDKTL